MIRSFKMDTNQHALQIYAAFKVRKEKIMQQKIKMLMKDCTVTFGELAERLNISKQTLTRKINGSTDWTYQEIAILTELFHIQDPVDFFYHNE